MFDPNNPLTLARKDQNEKETEEDALLQLDLEGSRPKERRNRVKFGYDSDSDENGEEWRARGSGGEDGGDESDESMFGDSDDESGPQDTKDTKGKGQGALAPKMLDVEGFERQAEIQVSNGTRDRSKSDHSKGGNASDDAEDMSDTSSVGEQNVDIDYFVNPNDDEIMTQSRRDELKKGTRREPKLESFSLRDDLEDGNFDQDGNFIRSAADTEAHQDQWLDGLSRKDIAKAKRAHEAQQRQQTVDSSTSTANRTQGESLLGGLIDILQLGESPLEALQRLAPAKRKGKKSWKSTKQPETARDDVSVAADKERKQKVEAITEAANWLESSHEDVYEMTREELQRLYQRQTGRAYELKRKRSPSPEPPTATATAPGTAIGEAPAQWEFKWEGSDDVHGPYDTVAMAEWDEQEYFDDRMSARVVGTVQFIPYSRSMFSSNGSGSNPNAL